MRSNFKKVVKYARHVAHMMRQPIALKNYKFFKKQRLKIKNNLSTPKPHSYRSLLKWNSTAVGMSSYLAESFMAAPSMSQFDIDFPPSVMK